jgi:hypothetical protein
MEILKTLTGQECQDLTLFAAATPASPLAPLANGAELMTLDTCGHGLETPLATYDHATQFWKTSEDISLWGEQQLLLNLPKSGMTRNGVLFQQPDWVRPIDATELLSWPTPRASAAMADSPEAILRNLQKKGYKSKLEQAVQMWPTPRAAQAEVRNHTIYARAFGKPQNLENRIAQREPSAIGGKLNPTWVEWLMGFPTGWTDLED